jgi:predicted amidophosphoribosyltransferase
VLKEFHALPTEARAKEMKDRDYLWCLVQQLLDREEELESLCPECRSRAAQTACPGCGQPLAQWGEGSANSSFDRARFERMKEGIKA